MKSPGCERIALDDLAYYAAGELTDAAAAAIEDHLFSCAGCGARAAEFEALVRAIELRGRFLRRSAVWRRTPS